MGDQQGARAPRLTHQMDEMNVQAINLGDEMGMGH